VFKSILTGFLVPPGLFVTAAVVAAFFRARRGKAGSGAMLALAALVWLSSNGYVADRLMAGLEAGASLPSDPQGDVIVLLGGGLSEGAPDLSGIGSPSDEMMGRIVTAARLQKRLGLPVLISGGRSFGGRAPEAPVVRRVLADLGVPAERIVVEERSRDTFENAAFTRRILDRYGVRRAILVTSAFHMRRARFLFEREGITVVPFPASFRTWKGKRFGWPDFVPSAHCMGDVSAAMKEYLGLAWYRTTLSRPAVNDAAGEAR
jgi:uncharacterized SAM-binding protein YcdF (DUF218 family)